MAGPLGGVTPTARAISRQRGRAQHPFLGAGATVRGLSCKAGPFIFVLVSRGRLTGAAICSRPAIGEDPEDVRSSSSGCPESEALPLDPGYQSTMTCPVPALLGRECVHGWARVGSWLEMMLWHWSTKRQHWPPKVWHWSTKRQHWLPKVWHWSTEWQRWLPKGWNWPHRVAALAAQGVTLAPHSGSIGCVRSGIG
jgi:hypothetical protein